ncbi:hypothetical protein DPEC_G00179260 [Dallia pectoralis]|uniref:Uncharacterized protein n=1 Tax=Dallia pectoralis TaxID=75939 RepID=A0ACC2GFV0_DALPE|nr:hypothetical protein DPEC_G00179260 [Dallia pectoralis]
MTTKGGIIRTNLRPFLDRLSQVGLFKIVIQGEAAEHILKILVDHDADQEGPVDVSILLEGREMFPGCGSTAKACTLLMGLIYALNLAYPPTLCYTFEVFQKLFLKLDVVKMSPKVQSLKLKLLS